MSYMPLAPAADAELLRGALMSKGDSVSGAEYCHHWSKRVARETVQQPRPHTHKKGISKGSH